MKILKFFGLVLFLSSVFTIRSYAQESDICKEPDVMAEYPGGKSALISYISENVEYPEECKKNKVQGKVFVSFIVDKSGKVVNTKVERGVDPLLDKEALRVVNSMGKWKPGTKDDKPVNVQFTLPIKFALN